MAIQKTEAIVLSTQPFRSSSLIVTFFSRSFGKMKGIAKGVRLDRELRGALYELFTRLEIVYYEKNRSDLHLLSEASIIESYEPMRTRLEPICYASYFAELVDDLTEIYDPHENIFDLLDFVFRYLPSLPGPRLARLFEIKLLNAVGWLPFLESCVQCGEKRLDRGFFSPGQGALLCPQCASRFSDAQALAPEPLAIMRYYIAHGLEDSIRQGMTRQTEGDLEALLKRFFDMRLHRPLESLRFLEQLKPAFH